MHGEVEHEAAEGVVFRCCVYWGSGVDENRLADVQSQM